MEDVISSHRPQARQRFQLGSYTANGGPGLGIGWIDLATGQPTIESWTTDVEEPSWITPSADGRTLYAVSELEPDGRISALRLDPQASTPTLLNTVTTGAKPAHLAVHPGGRFLFTSLYGGGAVAVHRLEPDGSIGSATDLRVHTLSDGQTEAHAHQVVITPDGVGILAVDLGTDTVYTYRLDPATGRLDETGRARFAAGSGPRHLAFHPTGTHAYVVHELNSTVTVCGWADGVLTVGEALSTVSAPSTGTTETSDPSVPNYPGEIVVSPDGCFVYVGNRGRNTVAVFSIADDGAKLVLAEEFSCNGDWPRHLAIDHTGRRLYCANERSGTVAWFPLDPATGFMGRPAGRFEAIAVTQFNLT